MRIGGKLFNFIILYRLPSQSQNGFETFLKNFQLNLDAILANNLFLTVVFGDFNVKSNLWCKSDKTSYKDTKIERIISQFGLKKIMSQHIILRIHGLVLI